MKTSDALPAAIIAFASTLAAAGLYNAADVDECRGLLADRFGENGQALALKVHPDQRPAAELRICTSVLRDVVLYSRLEPGVRPDLHEAARKLEADIAAARALLAPPPNHATLRA